MFKIIHTSDWHLGQTFHQYDRTEEFRFFLDQLYDIISEEKPDALCISGDIFDSMAPGLASQRLWATALERLSSLDNEMDIIAIAGNHDSGSKLEVYSHIFKDNIHIIGKKPEILKLKSKDGDEAVVCAVPYIPGSFYRNYLSEEERNNEDDSMKTFFRSIAAKAEKLRLSEDIPLILLAHTAVTGSDFRGQDEYKFNFNDVNVIGKDFDYVALGHIHLPQTIREGISTVRYCGAPMAMGFDEDYPHSVTVATFHNGVTELRQAGLKEFRLPITLFKEDPLKAPDVKKFLRKYKPRKKQYLRIYYHDDGNFTVEHRLLLESAFADNEEVKLCLILPVIPSETDPMIRDIKEKELIPDNISMFDPLDIARRYFIQKKNVEMPEHLVCLLKSAIYEDSQD